MFKRKSGDKAAKPKPKKEKKPKAARAARKPKSKPREGVIVQKQPTDIYAVMLMLSLGAVLIADVITFAVGVAKSREYVTALLLRAAGVGADTLRRFIHDVIIVEAQSRLGHSRDAARGKKKFEKKYPESAHRHRLETIER